MARRVGAWTLLAVALIVQSGCCCGSIWPRSFCCNQCGEVWWNEWFSHPPDCCDPCNQCGNFVGSRNPWVRKGPPPMGRPPFNDGYYGDASYDGGYDSGYESHGPAPTRAQRPTPAQPRPAQQRPTPAREPAPPADEPMPSSEPMPGEELPTADPNAGLFTNEFGQTVSYNQPVRMSRGPSPDEYQPLHLDEPQVDPRARRRPPTRPERGNPQRSRGRY